MPHIYNGAPKGLESAARKRLLPLGQILGMLEIRDGETVIDFGCGTGYFTVPLLDAVGKSGRVIAVDRSPEMLEALRKKAGSRKNLSIVLSDGLLGGPADLILLCTVLHELASPGEFLRKCLASLGPEGRLAVIDWQKKPTKMGPLLSHRISRAGVISMAGRDARSHRINSSLYFLVFCTTQCS